MILKHSPSLLPGDCVRRDPHDCALEKPESEPVKPPRVGTYVRVRWYHVEGLMLVFNVRDSLSRWEIDADQADLPDDRGDYLDGVFLDGWITQEGSIADNGECDRGRPTWARGVPHKSVPRASGSERSTRWEHISE